MGEGESGSREMAYCVCLGVHACTHTLFIHIQTYAHTHIHKQDISFLNGKKKPLYGGNEYLIREELPQNRKEGVQFILGALA